MAGERKRTGRPSSGSASPTARAPGRERKKAGGAAAAVRPDVFRERLGSLENLLDDALREAGGDADLTPDDGPLVRAAEGALGLYARLGRLLEKGSVAEALAGLGLGARPPGEDFGYDAEFERALGPLLEFLFTSWWRIETAGVDRVPEEGPALLVANSAGALFAYDGAMLRMAVRRRPGRSREVRPLLDPGVCDVPVLGEILSRCGGVRASEGNAQALLERGDVVACFPEGRAAFGKPFRRRHRIGPFHEHGFVRAALRVGAPVLPVAIVGAEEAHPVLGRLDWLARRIGVPSVPLTPTFPWLGLGGLLPLPSRWRIEFGAALSGAGGDRGPGDADAPRHVRAANERLRRRLQTLVDGAVERRGRAYL